jgi:selenocysteine lyase/cysteine desulfurase
MLRLSDGTRYAWADRGAGEMGVHADCRGPILRLSPGAVTTEEDVARLFDGLDRLRAR